MTNDRFQRKYESWHWTEHFCLLWPLIFAVYSVRLCKLMAGGLQVNCDGLVRMGVCVRGGQEGGLM